MRNLTDKQQEIYDQIVAWYKQYPQVAITATHLRKMFNISPQAINKHLWQLELKGFITRERGIRLK